MSEKAPPRFRVGLLRTSLKGDERGTVAIEFAIVMTLFLTILFGIVAFGFQFAARIALSYAVAEGGRAAVAGLTTTEREQLATEAINRVLTSFSPLIDPTKAKIDVVSEGDTDEGEAIKVGIIYDDSRFNVFPFLPSLTTNNEVDTTFLVADPSG